MKHIVIYRNKDGNSVFKVQVFSDKTIQEMDKKIAENNSMENIPYIVSAESVSNNLFEAVSFLIRDRRLDMESHLESLKDLKENISEIDDYLYSIIRDIRNHIEKGNN